jgi:hypothetical protein
MVRSRRGPRRSSIWPRTCSGVPKETRCPHLQANAKLIDGRDRGGESPGCSKEVLLCLTRTVSKICWRFYTGALRRRLTRSHSIVGALSMAIYQWDSKSTVWAAGVSFLLWWKVLEEQKNSRCQLLQTVPCLAVPSAAPGRQCSFGDTPS